jgi:Cdc6-like AAA superfamily ATPase
MITNARVLQQEFIPGEVKHRDAEVSHLSDTLRPLSTGDGRPIPSFLCGPSGVGKTCIARYTVNQLRENVVELNHQYVNCWEGLQPVQDSVPDPQWDQNQQFVDPETRRNQPTALRLAREAHD